MNVLQEKTISLWIVEEEGECKMWFVMHSDLRMLAVLLLSESKVASVRLRLNDGNNNDESRGYRTVMPQCRTPDRHAACRTVYNQKPVPQVMMKRYSAHSQKLPVHHPDWPR